MSKVIFENFVVDEAVVQRISQEEFDRELSSLEVDCVFKALITDSTAAPFVVAQKILQILENDKINNLLLLKKREKSFLVRTNSVLNSKTIQ